MPNHISNIIRLKLSDDDWEKEEAAFEALQALMKTEETPFDFDVLIPYPDPYRSLDEARDEAERRGVKWQDLPKDGFNQGGLQWRVANWGTKWNAYDIGIGYEEIAFCTAWTTPLPIWVELSRRFPEMRLEVEYADEDRGSNCGTLVYLNGEQIAYEDMSKQPHAELFARAVIAEQGELYAATELAKLEALLKKTKES